MSDETAIVAADRADRTSNQEFLSLVERLATNPDVDVQKLSAIMDLQDRALARQAEIEFNQAFNAMEQLLPSIKKDGDVHYKNKQTGALEKSFSFASWNQIDEIIRPIMREHGFSLSYQSAPRTADGGGLIVTGTLLHVSGHSRSASIPLALDSSGGKNSLQGMGSSFSYGKRYTATMLLNLTMDRDDDGNRGGTRFIDDDQASQIRALLNEAGRQEGPFLDRLFSGKVRSVEEIEAAAFVVVKNTLDGIIQQRAKKGPS